MVILYHNNNRIVNVTSDKKQILPFDNKANITKGLMQLARQFPKSLLVWCHQSLKDQLNNTAIESLFHHKKVMLSYHQGEVEFLGNTIGYVEQSPFIKINKKMSYPTWQMSSAVGGVNAEVLLALNNKIPLDKNFDYFLCSLAKLTMSKGLLCYSEPRLLKQQTASISAKTNPYTLFRFAKQHYKTQWVFLLLLNLFLYERKVPLLPFLFSLFYKNRTKLNINLDTIKVQSSKKVIDKATVDVIIPTFGRKTYLYDVLKDFKAQTHMPTNVIIVEQNPDKGSESELDYLTNEEWPFAIKHTFTHQAGACNARNVALTQISSEWVFFADDDIRIDFDFVQKALERINQFGSKAVSFRCFQKGQKQIYAATFQWASFGSGCSFVLANSLNNCSFNMDYEFGFGEDSDFGMQLRNLGHDVLYFPEPEILHLKAPIGGFRTKPVLRWHSESIQPKPSPTIMLFNLLHNSNEQINSYKTILFFKYYKHQKIKNPIRYYFYLQKQWKQSVFWANELQQEKEV